MKTYEFEPGDMVRITMSMPSWSSPGFMALTLLDYLGNVSSGTMAIVVSNPRSDHVSSRVQILCPGPTLCWIDPSGLKKVW